MPKMKSGDLKCLVESPRSTLVCLFLAAATLVVYGQVAGFELTNYDDPTITLENPIVLGGLTLRGVLWALTTCYYEYWHSLMWLPMAARSNLSTHRRSGYKTAVRKLPISWD
jgi:hypothetical protein